MTNPTNPTNQLTFPRGFLWGAATSAHQTEGNNSNADWFEWETDPAPKAPIAEPSGLACDHWHRYSEDIALLASLGLNSYRFSIEWARVEPRPGEFDPSALAHYSDMVAACLEQGVTPVVTLQHFTLPTWVARAGAWLNPDMVAHFGRYAARVAAALGDRVRYFGTINEPGNLLVRGYLGTFPAPPFLRDLDAFDRAAASVNACHRRARDVIKSAVPNSRVGMPHGLQVWRANPGGSPARDWARHLHEDVFFETTAEDDFIGVQTYTYIDLDAPTLVAPLTRLLLKSRRLTKAIMLPLLRQGAKTTAPPAHGLPTEARGPRRTAMGWLWAPEALETATRRIAALFPGKELLITEHGVATDHDPERIEYITTGLRSLHRLLAEGLPITGYFHWSLLDNFEWWDGYRPKFGLVAIDRTTQERRAKPSARFYGAVAANGTLPPDAAPRS